MISFEILPIIYFPIYIFIALYAVGYGFTSIALPEPLKKYTYLLTPWFTLVAITFLFTVLSVAGMTVRIATFIFMPLLLALTTYVLYKKRPSLKLIDWKNIAITGFIFICIALQLMPLLRRDRILTTVSLGNNDVIVYADTPDYLEDHSVFEGYKYLDNELKPNEKGIANLLHDVFRWGVPIVASFLQVITGLSGYQMAYLHLVILYSLLIPLAYVLFSLLYKQNWIGLIAIATAFLMNANMLYMLYHVFAGQILFWGMYLLLLIYFVSYFSKKNLSQRFTYFDVLIALTITTLYFSYHEGILFIVGPALLFGIFKLFDRSFIQYILTWSRIGFIVLLTGSMSVINGTLFDFFQASLIDAPIGWQIFRSEIPFANLFEMAGMHSLHTSPPMHWLIGNVASIFTGIIFLIGFLRSRMKLLLSCYIFVFVLMLIWSSVLHDNFFIYNRIVTYMLPLLLVIFAIGISLIYETYRNIGIGLLVIFVVLNVYSGFPLLKKFINNHISVDRSLISLQELNNEKTIKEPIYFDQVLMPEKYYWRMIWTEYFLYPNKDIISPSNYEKKNTIKDGNLVLVQSSNFAYPPTKVVLKPIVWENGYFKVGRLCNSNECLIKNHIPLSEVIIGKSEYEDTMLLSGWNASEGDHRWTNKNQASARFIVPEGTSIMEIEAQTLKSPQKLSIQIDGETVGELELKVEWDIYTIPLPTILSSGVHTVTFIFSNGYKPSEVLGNTDTRELFGNFKRITLR